MKRESSGRGGLLKHSRGERENFHKKPGTVCQIPALQKKNKRYEELERRVEGTLLRSGGSETGCGDYEMLGGTEKARGRQGESERVVTCWNLFQRERSVMGSGDNQWSADSQTHRKHLDP